VAGVVTVEEVPGFSLHKMCVCMSSVIDIDIDM